MVFHNFDELIAHVKGQPSRARMAVRAAGLALHVGDQLVKIVEYHAESLLTASERGPAPGPSQRPAC